MTSKTIRIAYKPVGLLLGAGAGLTAGLIFKQVWKIAGHDDDAPNATDEQRGWGEVLFAAALQGAIFALVKAGVQRAGGPVSGKPPANGRLNCRDNNEETAL